MNNFIEFRLMSVLQSGKIVFIASAVFIFCLSIGGKLFGQAPAGVDRQENVQRKLPGFQANGQILLSNQWSLKPAGTQVVLGDFPVNIAVHPKAPYAAILHAGYGEHEIVIVDLKTAKIISRVVLPQCFYGICFDPQGKRIFASGGEHEVVHQFTFSEGYISEHLEHQAADQNKKGAIAGVSCSPDGKRLFVADAWADRIAMIPLDDPKAIQFISLEKGSYPYAVLPVSGGSKLYVSLWGKSAVAVIDLKTGKNETLWKTQSHPTEMAVSPGEDVLYVACANSNAVTAIETATGKVLETINTALYPQAPNGSTPNSLALAPDGKVLLVANANNNNLAVIDVSQPGQSKPLGFIPTGWYPTSVRFDTSGEKIYVANGQGNTPKANRHGPNPLLREPKTIMEFIAGLYQGTFSIIKTPSPGEMARYTKQSYACSPLSKDFLPAARPAESDNPIPAGVGKASPIKHCIYIIKENRTYDQVFGDMPEGNGDKDLCIFSEKVTPNHHALAREFVLLDNFYVDSEVSADGHEWSMAAYATDFVEKTWPLNYRSSKEGVIKYPSEGLYPIAYPSSGYFWDLCKAAGVSYRSYGEFVLNDDQKEGRPAYTKIKNLEGHFDPLYVGWDLDYPDQRRADRFIEQLQAYEKTGDLPQFIVIRLPNDHTYGLRAAKPSPTAMLADNDLALGRIVEAISWSNFWKETAIFVVEDDAQNGSDHVDAHRTVALAISPYTKRHYIDSSLYSTSSMLRTMELILGLGPMTQFDAAALPMYASFQASPDMTPYKRRPVQFNLAEKNALFGWGAQASEELDFSVADAADDLQLNEIVWKSVRGADSPMPAPVRACFVFPHQASAADDD
jgi:YVTN family beta-propeller protein